jgi:hypothetical protein
MLERKGRAGGVFLELGISAGLMALPLYLHSGRPSGPLTKGLFYREMWTVHHFKLKWQLENVEQLAKSWEKMFYINICTSKLAEGHEHCTPGQNLSGSLHQGREKLGGRTNSSGGNLLNGLSTLSQHGEPGALRLPWDGILLKKVHSAP